MSRELEPGKVLDERFRITSLIREGGMASIYEAHDMATGDTVAVKVPFMRYESDPAFFSRFEREEAVGKSLHHPSILRFIDVKDKSRPYFVMERLRGRLLSQTLSGRRPLPQEEVIHLASRLAEALDYMHGQGVIHRDLKPSNIMLCDDGSLRILDFGLALSEDERRVTLAGHAPEMGTPDYMAPEQVKGRSKGARTDLYSLGAMMYEMATGRLPFSGPDRFAIMHARIVGDPVAPRVLNPQVSPSLEEIILHLMERDYHHRYASAGDLLNDLQAPQKVMPTGRDARLIVPDPWKIRWRRIRVTVWSLVFVVGALALYILSRPR